MALPSSGIMKASMIMQELKQNNGPWSINAKASRDLAKVPSGTIKFSDFYGKSAQEETSVNGLFMGNTGFYGGFMFNKETYPQTNLNPEVISINNKLVRVVRMHGSADETSNNFSLELDYNDASLMDNRELEIAFHLPTSNIDFKVVCQSFYSWKGHIVSELIGLDVLISEIKEFTSDSIFPMNMSFAVKEITKTL